MRAMEGPLLQAQVGRVCIRELGGVCQGTLLVRVWLDNDMRAMTEERRVSLLFHGPRRLEGRAGQPADRC